MLSPERERELLELALRGDRDATHQLVQSHMRLVLKIATRYERVGISSEDLVSEGVLGLLEALGRFELARGVRFAGYAAWWIRARIGQYAFANRRSVAVPSTRHARSVVREFDRAERRLAQNLSRAPSHEELAQEIGVPVVDLGEVRAALHARDLPLDQPQLADEGASPEQLVAQKQLELRRCAYVEAALGRLSARERTLVSEQYLAEDGRSLSELGQDFGVSRQRLGQVLSHARQKLKSELIHVA
jgi:RNA polymerase sigma-32 factor